MYRPEGLENPYPEWESLACQYHPLEWQLFEAGADAYAKALPQVKVFIKVTDKGEILVAPGLDLSEWRKGTFYFVPDEAK